MSNTVESFSYIIERSAELDKTMEHFEFKVVSVSKNYKWVPKFLAWTPLRFLLFHKTTTEVKGKVASFSITDER